MCAGESADVRGKEKSDTTSNRHEITFLAVN